MNVLKNKGKEKDIGESLFRTKWRQKVIRLLDLTENLDDLSSDSDTDDSSSNSTSSDSEDDEPITQEYLDSLLEKASQNVALLAEREQHTQQDKDDVLVLESSSQP